MIRLLDLMLRRDLAISYRKEVAERLQGDLFRPGDGSVCRSGSGCRIHAEIRDERLFVVAMHMHAGDGNVHTNIPVHSSENYAMLHAAERIVDRIMELTQVPGRGDLRRARHRNHQAPLPGARETGGLRAPTSEAGGPARDTSTAAS